MAKFRYNVRPASLYFDIHNLVCFQINSVYILEFIKDINQPLSYFEHKPMKDPDVILNVKKFAPDKKHVM